ENISGDVNEGFEIAGPAGFDLSGYRVHEFLGDTGAENANIDLSGIIPDEGCGYGAVWFPYGGGNLENGPDGFALSHIASATVLQTLAWEGSFIGNSAPAIGRPFEDVGVSEGNTPSTSSLQLIGGSTNLYDFSWSGPSPRSPGMLNTGQTIIPCQTNNRAPILQPLPSQVVIEENTLSFDVVASEIFDQDLITLTALSLPPGATFPPALRAEWVTNTFNWVNAGPAGVYTAAFQAVDVDGMDTSSVEITVLANVTISEIMYDPVAVSDNVGEWFEIFNKTTNAVDINGWTITDDDDSEIHVINNGGPLILQPDGFLVLGNNGNTNLNGGVALDYVYPGFIELEPTFFSDDFIVLRDNRGFEVARVEFGQDEVNFPVATGASLALCDPSLDMNVDANWIVSAFPWPGSAGDRGTPGQPNDKGIWGSNLPPQLSFIPSRTVVESNNLNFTVSAVDADFDTITLSAVNLPPGASFPPQANPGTVNGPFNWFFASPPGTYTTTFFAVDNDGSVSQDVVIVVKPKPPIWINEVDYDQPGAADSNEWIELAGQAGVNVGDYELLTIDGATGVTN
ncbi:MAG: lamin tail domain-containing protein, partial [Verrucomicrobiota bacterium]